MDSFGLFNFFRIFFAFFNVNLLKMGWGMSKQYIDEISDSESDSEDYFAGREPRKTLQVATESSKDTGGSVDESEEGSSKKEDITSNNAQTPVDNTLDALVRPICMPNPVEALNLENIQEIEKRLDEYEIVSLMYLITESTNIHHTKQEVFLYLHTKNRQILTDWAMHTKEPWQLKIIEGLCIIQNYQILKELGYKSKTDLKLRFLPQNGAVAEVIDKTRKKLYLIAEKFDDKLTRDFVKIAKQEFTTNELSFTEFESEYLELYFLDWECCNIDFQSVLKTIRKVLKQMNLEVLGDNLPYIYIHMLPANYKQEQASPSTKPTEKVTPTSSEVRPPETSYQSNSRLAEISHQKTELPPTQRGEDVARNLTEIFGQRQAESFTVIQPRSNHRTFRDTVQGYIEGGDYIDQASTMNTSISAIRRNSDNCYCINRTSPGKVLIIDQKYFYTEPDVRYADILHKGEDKLSTREGTEQDSLRVKAVFDKFGFKVQIKSNLAHYDMVQEIISFVDSITQASSMFIFILSHGEKGVVFGSNSCWVPVDKIEKLMVTRNTKNLKKKPKLLILQSCQGLDCQKIEDDNMSEDEPEESLYTRDSSGPKTADVLKFWATVPGFAAVRNRVRGSWFIQALCDAIEKHHMEEHFLDICTRVNLMVSNRRWREENGTNIMMPMLVHTFRKHFYFPETQ